MYFNLVELTGIIWEDTTREKRNFAYNKLEFKHGSKITWDFDYNALKPRIKRP